MEVVGRKSLKGDRSIDGSTLDAQLIWQAGENDVQAVGYRPGKPN